MIQYKFRCKKCKKKRKGFVVNESRSKGVKILCIKCGTESGWINYKFVKEMKSNA